MLVFALLASCASGPTYEADFDEGVFRSVAEKSTHAAPKRLGPQCRIVVTPDFDHQLYQAQDGSVPGVLAARGLSIMVPIMMPLNVFENETVLDRLPSDGAAYGVKFGIRDYHAEYDEGTKKTIVTKIVLYADVFDPAGTLIGTAQGSGEGRRNALVRVYKAAELSCAHAIADALNDLGVNLTTKHPELDFLIH